jgi:hypothetical protein
MDTVLDEAVTPAADTPTGELAVINHEGDTKIMWNRHNETEVEAARRHFDYLQQKGHTIFRMGRNDAREGQIREFDPTAERLIAVPQMQGG